MGESARPKRRRQGTSLQEGTGPAMAFSILKFRMAVAMACCLVVATSSAAASLPSDDLVIPETEFMAESYLGQDVVVAETSALTGELRAATSKGRATRSKRRRRGPERRGTTK